MIATIVEVQTAINLGYTVNRDIRMGHRFSKKSRLVWGDGSTWYASNIVRGQIMQAEPYKKVIDALNGAE